MVERIDPILFQRLMAILPHLGDPPSDEVLTDPHAVSSGAVLPVWFEMPYPVLVVAQRCSLPAAHVVLYAIQEHQLTSPWWSELQAICRYAQSLQMLALLRSLPEEDRERVMGHAEASVRQYDFKRGLSEMNPKWTILCDLHSALGAGGVDKALQEVQVRIEMQEKYIPSIVDHLVRSVNVPVVA